MKEGDLSQETVKDPVEGKGQDSTQEGIEGKTSVMLECIEISISRSCCC